MSTNNEDDYSFLLGNSEKESKNNSSVDDYDFLLQQKSPTTQKPKNLVETIANSAPVNVTLGLGDAIRNMMANTANVVPGVNIPMEKSGEGGYYKAGNVAGNILGYAGGGEVLGATKIARALGNSNIAGAARRLAGGSAYGAIENPEDRLEGAGEGLLGAGIGEAIPGAFKTLKGAGEFLNPKEYTNKLVSNIRKNAIQSENLAKEHSDPVLNEYGKKHMIELPKPSSEKQKEGYSLLTQYPELLSEIKKPLNLESKIQSSARNFLGFGKDQIKYFTPDVKKLYSEFLENPNFENAHKLQSQLGVDYARISRSPNKPNTAQTLREARDSVKQKMFGFLNKNDPSALASYKKGSDIYRDEVVPHYSTDTLKKISQGTIKEISPQKLSNAIQKGKEKIRTGRFEEKSAIPESHYLSKELENLNKKITRGKGIQDVASIAGGLALGEAIMPGVSGGAMGAALAKFLAPSAVKVIQNPSVEKGTKNVGHLYELLRKGAISNTLGS